MYMTKKRPNHLIKENSPYLLQHAHNPVDWHPWGVEALEKAREQNKLLIVSIGYSACHWCHVMEHESFGDEEVAVVMNRDFISVKVDREERPDVDQIYMAAAYATTGRGGWPLNVIALPDQRPVFAGTYFAKSDWIYILNYFTDLHQSHPEELLHQASEIVKGMKRQQHLPHSTVSDSMETMLLHDIFTTWEEDLDFVNGGTHGAPKFPMPACISSLLKYGFRYKNRKAMDYVELTLDKIARGGIYDHLGGGFSRYSVDAFWHVPHFEKMLYDNAQLISLYSQAYSAFEKKVYKSITEESIAFIERELTSPEGLFYSSLDADSDGTEGAFYTWTSEDIRKNLGDSSAMFLDYYTCEDIGNLENSLNVLRKSCPDEDFAIRHNIHGDQLSAFIETCKNQLFTVRSNRIRPATDNKILTCWNALMISALTDAAHVFNNPNWLKKAIVAVDYFRIRLIERNGKLWRNSNSESLVIPGFLDDYCFLIKSFLDVYQSTLDEIWLTSAELLTREVLLHFTAEDMLFFNLSSGEEPRLIHDSIELSDNVIPASNSQMAKNLFVLGHLLENEGYLLRSEEMLKKMIPQIKRNPAFHANWASLLADFIAGPATIIIVGNTALACLKEFGGKYLPNVIFSGHMAKISPHTRESANDNEKTLIYICRDKTCYNPVETVQDALQILGQH